MLYFYIFHLPNISVCSLQRKFCLYFLGCDYKNLDGNCVHIHSSMLHLRVITLSLSLKKKALYAKHTVENILSFSIAWFLIICKFYLQYSDKITVTSARPGFKYKRSRRYDVISSSSDIFR